MRNRLIRLAGAATFAAVMAGGSVAAASAHDVHTFGKFTIALGWLHEPAYVGFDNAVQVLVKDSKGDAFTDISDKDLTVEVSLGSAKMAAKPLLPTADPDTGLGIPGEYELHFIPTAPGAYTFHIKGAVGGQAIDETVQASDKTFDEVKGDADVEFPQTVPATSELSTKLTQLDSRLSGRLDSDRAAADDRAKTDLEIALGGSGVALLLAIVALVVGLRAGKA